MSTSALSALLKELASALGRMRDILQVALPQSAAYWDRVVADAMEGVNGGPVEARQLTRTVLNGFGVGMGSLGDVYIGDEFDLVRQEIGLIIARIGEAVVQVEGFDRAVVRTLLVELETLLLDAGDVVAAASVRRTFSVESLSRADVLALADEVARENANGLHREEIQVVVTRLRLALEQSPVVPAASKT